MSHSIWYEKIPDTVDKHFSNYTFRNIQKRRRRWCYLTIFVYFVFFASKHRRIKYCASRFIHSTWWFYRLLTLSSSLFVQIFSVFSANIFLLKKKKRYDNICKHIRWTEVNVNVPGDVYEKNVNEKIPVEICKKRCCF